MANSIFKFLFFFVFASSCVAQKNQKPTPVVAKPKLVVGIVVDQMRYDYLYRFYDKYSDGGLKRLMNEGFNCRNNQYHYASTVTGPGHAHIYTGSVPAISGIVGNDWYDKQRKIDRYVVQDDDVKLVGEGSESAGKMSPMQLKVTTITDQLRIASQFQSKVIGVAIKDRGAILPAGHTGSAYWFDSRGGNWITSSYYQESLPDWASEFNNQGLAKKYSENLWETLMPISDYTETEEDEQGYESNISGESKPVFPHKISLGSLASTPFGNTLTLDFALAAMKGEKLGKGEFTDFLAISFSSPDYAGHAFGPQSKEIEDIYLKLDLDFQRLLTTLDSELGAGNYSVFLSADHGVAEIPAFLKKHNVPAGFFLGNEFKGMVDKALNKALGEGNWILNTDNYELYLNQELMSKKKVTETEIRDILKETLNLEEGIYNVISLKDLESENIPEYYKEKLRNIYNPKRSGELMILPEPAWFSGYKTGTTHGTMYAYDTHVPLLFYGWGINKGETTEPTYISDIAPTIAQLLKILEPNGSVGKPVSKALK